MNYKIFSLLSSRVVNQLISCVTLSHSHGFTHMCRDVPGSSTSLSKIVSLGVLHNRHIITILCVLM